MTIATTNPATGERVRTFDPLTPAELEARLELARDAAGRWRRTPISKRIEVVTRAAALLDQRKREYGRLMTLEMGKPIKAAVEEAAKCATGCRYYAEHAERFLADEAVDAG